EQRGQLRSALQEWNRQVRALGSPLSNEKIPRLLPQTEKVLDVTRKLLGEDDADYATSLGYMGVFRTLTGDRAGGEPLLRQALAIRRKLLGERHPAYADSLHELALHYHHFGDYARAEPLIRLAAGVYKESLGGENPQ